MESEVSVIHSLSGEINTTLDLHRIFQVSMGSLDEAFGFHHSLILLADAKGQNLEVVASHGYPESGIGAQIPTGLGVIGVAAKRKKLLRSVAIQYHSLYARMAATGAQAQIRQELMRMPGLKNAASQMAIPLMVKEELIGIYAVESPEPGAFDALDEQLLSVIGSMVGSAIANARAYQEIEDLSKNLEAKVELRTTELNSLNTLARKANEAGNLSTLAQTLFNTLRSSLGLENFALFLIDDRDSQLVLVSRDTVNPVQHWTTGEPVAIEKTGFVHKTWKRKRTLYLPRLPDRFQDPDEKAMVEAMGVQSMLLIPLIVSGRVVALLICGPSHRLNREEIQSAERYCYQIAGAVRVFALLHTTQEAREEAEAAKEEAEQARSESDALLENVLPSEAARELKETGRVEPVYYDSVSVLFTDFVGFTRAAASLRPSELIQELDGCFSQFDEVARRNRMEKLKTIGDAYMCAGGLPRPSDSHAVDACLTALEFRSFMKQMAEVKQQLGFEFWQIRIGIHSGPVTAGVIGQNKFAYDIWGDTVNVASRMESSGEPGMVNISGATYEQVKDLFECEYRGKVQAKGKGEMDMYFLHRIRGEFSADQEGLIPNDNFNRACIQSSTGGATRLSEIDSQRQGW